MYVKMRYSILAAMMLGASLVAFADTTLAKGAWTFTYSDASGDLNLSRDGEMLFKKVQASVRYNFDGDSEERTIATGDVAPEVSVTDCSDEFGTGRALTLAFHKDGATMTQSLALYDNQPYFIARVTVKADNGATLHSGYMIPFAIGEEVLPFSTGNNRMLWVPFDNDGHLAYENFKIGASGATESVSHEVGCVYNVDTRFGLVAGSVDHDCWKSGVTTEGRYLNRVSRFECLSGLSNYFTHDGLPHGKVKGTEVSSARFMVGAFDDWREGLYAFGDANAAVAPRLEWEAGNPIGWSSWGVQMERISYDGVMESARFMKDNLFDRGFHDADGRMTISLDSFAEDNITAVQLVNMAKKAFGDGTTYTYNGKKEEGMNMVLGLYGGPFTIWSWSLDADSKVPGTGVNGVPEYKWSDMALKVNGGPHSVWPGGNYYASDPTHPAVEALIKYSFDRYAARGAKYVKVDFMNCGICQGDSYYNPEITTAVQAYSYGMEIMRREAEKHGIYIVLAMSPAFPYEYAHGRRTCCDRFSQLGESEYVMNATSYGFWMDRLYTVLDPDQMVMCKSNYGARETDGENRVRATTGMVTGAFIFGDNFSDKVTESGDNGGVVRGYPEESRRRAMDIMGNPEINEYVRTHTGAFMPVEGKAEYTSPNSCEGAFVRHSPEADYVAVFNFSSTLGRSGEFTYERLGVNADTAGEIREMWFGTTLEDNGDEKLHYNVPKGDVRVYRIANTSFSGIQDTEISSVESEAQVRVILSRSGGCDVKSSVAVKEVRVYAPDGRVLGVATPAEACHEVSFPCAPASIAVVSVGLADGTVSVNKYLAH